MSTLDADVAIVGYGPVGQTIAAMLARRRHRVAAYERFAEIYRLPRAVYVRWQASVVPYGECIEVTGSHVGLIFNRKAYRAIATALANPELP